MNTAFDVQPLYAQVKHRMIERLVTGEWRPGNLLPSEMDLASEYGISQGTVRKALDSMASENLLVRKQGKGTFVAEHDPHRALFHFFNMVGEDGVRELPSSRVIACERHGASASVAARLLVQPESTVIQFRRVRSLHDQPVIIQTVTLPEALFPGFEPATDEELPNTLYTLYEREYGINVTQATERLRAVAANEDDASLLGLAVGTPLLEIDRTAFTYNRKPVELRVGRCATHAHHYLNEID